MERICGLVQIGKNFWLNSQKTDGWGSSQHMRVTFKANAFQMGKWLTLFVTPTCVLVRSESSVSCRMKVRVWCGRRWANCNYLRAPIIAFWNWHARSQTWRGVKKFSPRIWGRRCSIVQRLCRDSNMCGGEDTYLSTETEVGWREWKPKIIQLFTLNPWIVKRSAIYLPYNEIWTLLKKLQ